MEPGKFKFEWDTAKAATNAAKHGVEFEEAATVFDDLLAGIGLDRTYSIGEQRWLIIGVSGKGRILLVSHTERGEVIRIISAREATRAERVKYERG